MLLWLLVKNECKKFRGQACFAVNNSFMTESDHAKALKAEFGTEI